MADARHPMPLPRDWSDAFDALPLEAPPAGRWPAIAATLDARRASKRRVRWLAIAASLLAVAALPALWLARDSAPDAPSIASTGADARGGTDAVRRTAASERDAAAETATAQDAAASPADAPVATGRALAAASPTDGTAAMSASSRREPRRAEQARIADTGATPSAPHATSATDASATALETLYAESAQLEALVSIARDARVSSGPAAALSGELDAQLAAIDARIAQPELPESERVGLWQARVEALRQVASFEGTQRWLSAQGERYDGALVSID